MKRFLKTIPTVALVVAGVLLSLQIARGQTTVVAVSPASRTVAPTVQCTLDVTVSGVVGLHAASVKIAFDKNILQYDGVTLGSFLPTAIMLSPYVRIGAVYDTINVDQAILGADSGNGSGTLLNVQFTALSVGATPIILTTVDLRTPQDEPIPNTRQDGQVTVSPATVANVKVLLEGPFNGTTMNTAFRVAGLVPLTQPYNVTPWNYAGSEAVITVPASVVDWVLVELRSTTTTVAATRAAFIKSDGMVVDSDGVSAVGFPSVTAGSYYIVIRHRNHLAVMSANAVALNSTSTVYDFTASQASAYNNGSNGLKAVGTKFAMFAGNGNGDGSVNATDRNAVWRVQNGSLNVYYNGDFNLDTYVNATDRNSLWRVNNGKLSQVP